MYSIAIYLYMLAVGIAALFNTRARKLALGHQYAFVRLKRMVEKDARYIWFHAASLGEFEQGRPLMERLRREPMPKEELELVRTCMLGDFMRSVDGVFERSERFCQMLTSGIDERFTDNFLAVLEPDAVTTEGLCVLADSLLNPNDMVFVNAGIV